MKWILVHRMLRVANIFMQRIKVLKHMARHTSPIPMQLITPAAYSISVSYIYTPYNYTLFTIQNSQSLYFAHRRSQRRVLYECHMSSWYHASHTLDIVSIEARLWSGIATWRPVRRKWEWPEMEAFVFRVSDWKCLRVSDKYIDHEWLFYGISPQL